MLHFGTAGRGGRVCKVTNLQDRGEGSFRACAERGGPRIVVFETGGTIVLDEEIRIADPYVSIYGQTAPGDGILLRSREGTTDSVLRMFTQDVLVQRLRLSAAAAGEPTCRRDALPMAAGGGPGVYSVSFHHNLLACSNQRNPSVDAFGVVDVVDNLVYRPVDLSAQVQTSFATARVNLVGKRWIPFTSPADPDQRTLNAFADVRLHDTGGNGMQAFFQDNLARQRRDASEPQ